MLNERFVAIYNKNILMILQSDYPPDIRLTKEMKTLLLAGFTIYLLCNNNKRFVQQEVIAGTHVHRLKKYSWLPAGMAKMIRPSAFWKI